MTTDTQFANGIVKGYDNAGTEKRGIRKGTSIYDRAFASAAGVIFGADGDTPDERNMKLLAHARKLAANANKGASKGTSKGANGASVTVPTLPA